MRADELSALLGAAGVAAEVADAPIGPLATVDAATVVPALAALADGGFDMLVDLFGSDTGERIEVTYHVRMLGSVTDAYVRCALDYDGELASVWRTYPAALYPEREAAELYGFSLVGHPNPKRLLTVEGSDPLLRKSVAIRGAEEVRL